MNIINKNNEVKTMKTVGIYVHVPFCKQKCKYCDFISFQNCENYFDDYFECLKKEITEKADEINSENKKILIDTIYFGGGTPSIVCEKYIEEVLKKIYEYYNVSENAEITVEVNPGTVDKFKLEKYFEIGINRLSIGLQSTDDKLLKMLGRIHTYKEFGNTYDLARKIGFKNINVDLMIGLPNQSLENVNDSLEKIAQKNPEHISVYSLIIEENTKMFDLIEKGELELPDEDVERKMYWSVKKFLEENGYIHYEISNFSKSGFESKHNANCWNQHEYLGFGIAAHSYFNNIRYSNIDNLRQYIENWKNEQSVYNIVFHEHQNKDDMMKEFMMLGLRKIDGVKISEFKEKFVDNPIFVFRNQLNKLVKEGLIEVLENNIRLSDKGLDLANEVWMEFV